MAGDGGLPRGDGLPERVIVDAALWRDLLVRDGPDGHADGRIDGVGDGGAALDGEGAADGGASGPVVACALAEASCLGQESCYPDEALSGATSCLPAPPGSGVGRFPCQVQNDCAAGNGCVAVPGTGKVCLQICRTADGATSCLDFSSTACVPFRNYPGLGACM